MARLDTDSLRRDFVSQGAFVYVDDFLAPEVTAQLVSSVAAVEPAINRNYLPGHKQGGSVSRHTLDQLAPCIAELYRSPSLISLLEKLAGERLQVSPPDDPHAYALYFYTKPGDHIGWHYDTSYYAGRRYTVLLGVLDQSSCRLDYELHTRETGAAVVPGSVQIPPGGLVFFDGDKLRHRISPLGENEKRVSLTFEYVTDQRMHPWWRLISNLKDAVAYFGLRQVFRRRRKTRGPMTRAAVWLLTAGVLLFAGVLISQGLTAVFATLAVARWGLPLVALLHLVPLALDAASIRVMFDTSRVRSSLRDAVLARWVGESANSFLPAGPIGGPVVMARYFAQRGMTMRDAAAGVTVSTTLQALAQMIFALMGVAMLGAHASQGTEHAIRIPLIIAGGVLAFCLTGFYLMQRRGLFGKLMRVIKRFSGKRDWAQITNQADAIDLAVQDAYGRRGRAAASFLLSFAGWVIGTAEVYLILQLLQFPVAWGDALLLESLGQAIRAAGFAIPGSLGIQEGGFLLLAPLAGLRPETALALSLAKRAREVILGAPGLLYLHLSERGWRRRLVV